MTTPALIATYAIPRFLDSIRKTAVPPKVDGNYLKGIGFKSNNDTALIPLFKSLGFLDSSGKPTTVFRQYRGASEGEAKQILGTAVTACYSGLFSVYPDAYRKDDEALTNWLRANTDKGEATQKRALKTFKALRDAASFDETPPTPTEEPSVNGSAPGSSNGAAAVSAAQHIPIRTGPDISINITLQIAATNDSSIYDKFFSSMRKNLFPDES